MKFLILILALHNANCGQSSCVIQPKIEHLLFKEQHYLYELEPLENLLKYKEVKNHVNNILNKELGKCSTRKICTARSKKIDNYLNELYSFCEMYFKFENNKKYVFTFKRIETFWFFYFENFTMDSSQVFNTSENIFITKR